MPQWIKATEKDLEDMGRKHWREAKTKHPLTAGAAYTFIKSDTNEVEWLCEEEVDQEELSEAETKNIEQMADRVIKLCDTERRLLVEAYKFIDKYRFVAPAKDLEFTKSKCEKWLDEFKELSKQFYPNHSL